MKVERFEYGHWPAAYRCTAGAAELVVVTGLGPRILPLRLHGGANLLYEDATGFGVGDWRLYGGHRFTVAPEGDETYAPDNAPCNVEMHAWDLRITAPLGTNGTRRLLVIGAAADGTGFDIRHFLGNHGPRPCWRCDAGWLASLQPDATLVIQNPDTPPVEQCVDDGCNVEVFTCADYVELETLGGELTLAPGECATHLQRWRLLAPRFAPHDWAAIGAQAAGISSSRIAHHVS